MSSKNIKVLQLIDSLAAGGAERVAVNFANGLKEQGIESFICATRAEGPLKVFIKESIPYLFLDKKSSIDFKAIFRLVNFVKKNKINIVHAHSSSFFLAVIIKFLCSVKVVWHDHYGKSEFLEQRENKILKFLANKFDYVFVVNNLLGSWAVENLKVKADKVQYLPNYPDFGKVVKSDLDLTNPKGKNIICLANLREQKDHITLLKAFKSVVKNNTNTKLFLVGKDFDDEYSQKIHNIINEFKNNEVVFLGSRNDIPAILKQMDLGVLTSKSEGLPLAILEYGLAKLPVLCTNVGQCSDVIRDQEMLLEPKNIEQISEKISFVLNDDEVLQKKALETHQYILEKYSKKSVLKTLEYTYSTI